MLTNDRIFTALYSVMMIVIFLKLAVEGATKALAQDSLPLAGLTVICVLAAAFIGHRAYATRLRHAPPTHEISARAADTA